MESSFSALVKDQLSRIPIEKKCDARAEAYGLLLFAAVFTPDRIRFVTEQPALLHRLPYVFKTAFSLNFEVSHAASGAKTGLTVSDPEAVRRIFNAFGLDADRAPFTGMNRAVLEEECCRTAFLRGVFLGGGSVADPMKRYHLEIVTSRYNLSRELISFLQEMELEPKCTLRRSNYVLYFKYSELIENFLTRIGSPMYAMKIMSAKVEKDVRNQINRKVNCETANITKTVNAAYVQCRAIAKLREAGAFDALPDVLRETAVLREDNPDLPLSQLAALFDPPLNRTTLNYRLNRLIELSAGEGK